MNLNLHVIEDELGSWCMGSYIHGAPEVLTCSHPLPYVAGMGFFDTPVYVAEASSLPEEGPLPRVVNLVAVGAPSARYLRPPFNTLVVDGSHTLVEVFERIMGIFARYNEWERDLERAIEDGWSLTDFGGILLGVFGNPINLWSADFKSLLHLCGPIDREANVLGDRLEALLDAYGVFHDGEYLDANNLHHFAADPVFGAIADGGVPAIYDGGEVGVCRALVHAIKDEVVKGYLIIDEVNHAIGARDMALAVAVSPCVARALTGLSDAPRVAGALDGLLSSLVTGVLVSDEQIDELLLPCGWHRTDEYVVFALKPRAGLESAGNLRALSSYVVRCAQDVRAFLAGPYIALVTNGSKVLFEGREPVEKVVRSMASGLFAAGQSEPFSNLALLADFYRQACVAVESSLSRESKDVLVRYADCYVADMMGRCRGDLSLEAAIPAPLQALMRWDERNDGDLVPLLSLYLDHAMNAAETARAAFIHRNTCINKLRLIREVSGLDLSDPLVVLAVRLGLSMLGFLPHAAARSCEE